MEMDTNINDVLREVITFLECLRDAQLPLVLENLREKLLIRSKNTLSVKTTMTTTTTTTTTPASSVEPYLDMKSGPRSLLLTKSGIDSEEYVGMEESQKKQTHQDYYETFENDCQIAATPDANEFHESSDDQNESQKLMEIYKNLSAMQIRSKCYKCGPLYRKEGKKLFLSENRACWIALVGSHLLIYRSERHNRPYAIYSIRDYMARPAPNMIPRDRQKSESAFEMYSPGSETLQFIARTPKDMEQWIAKVCEVGCCDESERNKVEACKKKRRAIAESPTVDDRKGDETMRLDGHRNAIKPSVVDKSTAKAESVNSTNKEIERKDARGNAPPLPARIPRRLPSLPLDDPLAVSSYKTTVEDDDDDDDIYHRIEDLKNEMRYQNMVLSRKHMHAQQVDAKDKRYDEATAYDDVHVPNQRNERNEERENKGQIEEKDSRNAEPLQETYDDIITLSRTDSTNVELERNRNKDASIVDGEKKETEELYDDVENLVPNRRFDKDRIKNQNEVSSKHQKKSFLNRVLSRKESSSKSDKRYKNNISMNPSSSITKERTYDDMSDLTLNQEFLADKEEELSEYNCVPPPRPICKVVKSPIVNQNSDEIEEFYDDVSVYQEECNKSHQQTLSFSTDVDRDSCAKTKETAHNVRYNVESMPDNDSTREEIEHYQSPKSDLYIPETEQLYDDIALWADFTTRQRSIIGKREDEDVKSVASDKKTWNRFTVNRKSRVTNDFNGSIDINRRAGNEGEEIEDSPENNGVIKRNTFQKLISRMENSLAKVSTKNPSSLSIGKSNAPSNNS